MLRSGLDMLQTTPFTLSVWAATKWERGKIPVARSCRVTSLRLGSISSGRQRGYISAEINAQYEEAESNIFDDVASGMAFDD